MNTGIFIIGPIVCTSALIGIVQLLNSIFDSAPIVVTNITGKRQITENDNFYSFAYASQTARL